MAPKNIFQVKIGNPLYGGNFLSRLNGKAVFVPFVLPEELVKITPVVEQKNYSIAELIEVSTPSKDRIEPVCDVYGKCGGCHYQHINRSAQLQLKVEILIDQLTKIGKLIDPPVLPILANEQAYGYRNHIQFTPDPRGKLCFVGRETNYPFIPIRNCPIASPGLIEVAKTLELDPEMRVNRVSIREGVDGMMVILDSDQTDVPEIAVEGEYSVVHVSDEDSVVIAGDNHIVINVLDRPFKVSSGSFFQVNTEMAGVMVRTILESAEIRPTDTVIDVYCGVGLFSAFIATLVEKLICVEENPSSCADFVENLDRFENVELYEADAAAVLPNLDQKADVVIVDPPRAGIEKSVLRAIVELEPRTIIYVSCDPSTLARDLSRFRNEGYVLRTCQPIDMFPQTYHIEAVCVLAKSESQGQALKES